jgi:MFS family permease
LHTSYVSYVLPGQLVLGVGLCALFIPLSSAALIDVSDHDAGAASGMLGATQQVGGAVGIALFSTLYASAVTSYSAAHPGVANVDKLAQLHGYIIAFRWSAAAMTLAAITAYLLIRMTREDMDNVDHPPVL